MNYSSNLFENDFDKYQLIIDFIIKLSSNNSIIKTKMKDYLRIQYNNSNIYNLISLLANILVKFNNEKSNLSYINKYYIIIIKIIDCLTKCCNGPSFDNQHELVMNTDILIFLRNILKKISYRNKQYNDSGLSLMPSLGTFGDDISENYEDRIDNNKIEECTKKGLNRQKLSFLSFKSFNPRKEKRK